MTESYERGGYTITISYDPGVPDPRGDFAGCGLVLSHRRYSWPNDAEISFGIFDGWEDVAAELRMHHGALVIMPVWMIDHSGTTMRAADENPFRDPWDSGQLGFAYITAETWAMTQGAAWEGTDEQVAQARKLIEDEVETFGEWCAGETYQYEITSPDGDQAGACSGYIGWDSAVSAADAEADRLAAAASSK
jgi:hypothetical protein